jgi:hypothetical protein
VYLLTQPQRRPPTCPRTGAHLGLWEDGIEELMQAISELDDALQVGLLIRGSRVALIPIRT